MKDDQHEIYQWGSVWRFADFGVATYCESSNALQTHHLAKRLSDADRCCRQTSRPKTARSAGRHISTDDAGR